MILLFLIKQYFLSFVSNVLIFFLSYVFYLEVHKPSKSNSKAHYATESNLTILKTNTIDYIQYIRNTYM